MTSYHGGKQRIGKQLAEVIVDLSVEISNEENFKIRGYCEPFCGMLGVYRHIPGTFEEDDLDGLVYKAGDSNGSVIAMWKAAQKGWKPPSNVSETQYEKMKHDGKDSATKGFVGHQYGFGGQWFNGYGPKYGKTRTAYNAASNRVQTIAEELHDVNFTKGEYRQFSNLKGFVLYCDPPYADTKCHYSETKTFDTTEFWKWCKKMAEFNLVFVSGYTAPKDIETIFTSTHKISGYKTARSRQRIEKLFLV